MPSFFFLLCAAADVVFRVSHFRSRSSQFMACFDMVASGIPVSALYLEERHGAVSETSDIQKNKQKTHMCLKACLVAKSTSSITYDTRLSPFAVHAWASCTKRCSSIVERSHSGSSRNSSESMIQS